MQSTGVPLPKRPSRRVHFNQPRGCTGHTRAHWGGCSGKPCGSSCPGHSTTLTRPGLRPRLRPGRCQRDWQSAARCRRGPAGGAVGPPPGSPPARPPPRRGAGTRRMRPAPRLTCAPPPAGPLKARRSAGHPSRAGEPASGRLPRTTGAGAPRPRLSLRSEHPGDWPGLRRRRVQPQPPAPLGARVEPHAPGERSSLSRKHLSHQLRQGERTGRAAAHAPPLPLCFGGFL